MRHGVTSVIQTAIEASMHDDCIAHVSAEAEGCDFEALCDEARGVADESDETDDEDGDFVEAWGEEEGRTWHIAVHP